MHARHRNPGNGFRPNYMGMGNLPPASRISPEGGSFRGHGMYNSDYRNYNRGGFGRGQPKPFQPLPPPPPPPRGGDVFMEAGRLATEYLVSKGVLPPNVLSGGKWQNGNLRNQAGQFQGFRPQGGDNLLPPESRSSGVSRLGNVFPDTGSARNKFPNQYDSAGSRDYMRERRRMGSFKNYGPDVGREIGRSGSWSDKAKGSLDTEAENVVSGYLEEQQVGNDVGRGLQKSHLAEISDPSEDSNSTLDKYQVPDDNKGSNASSSSTGKDLPSETHVELTKRSEESKIESARTGVPKDDTSTDEMEIQTATDDVPNQHSDVRKQHGAVEADPVSKNDNDLVSLCRFVKMPTRTRSSLTIKGSKVDPVPIAEEEKHIDAVLTGKSVVPVEDFSVDGASCDTQSIEFQTPRSLQSDMLKAPTVGSTENAGDLGCAHAIEQGKCIRSKSFPGVSFMNEQESSEGSLGFRRSSSMVIYRGEKRALPLTDSRDGAKRIREWGPSLVSQDDEFTALSNLMEDQPTLREEMTPLEEVKLGSHLERSVDMTLFPNAVGETGNEYGQEKQLFRGSFKICDLNLMEASDVTENPSIDTVHIFPSIPESKNEAAPVDIDLSMSNNCNVTDKYGESGADDKVVEVIDLEDDFVQEDKPFNNSERKAETEFTVMECFPNHAQNTNDVPDAQDGYGLMISELLGTDISNCPSVSADINSLNNDMGLHNGEGILGDDESIYMSLGEIPISFLRVWEQPTQEYDKHF